MEGGEIRHAVEEITIAGNLKDMLLGISAVGNDVIVRGSKQCGSILIDRITVAAVKELPAKVEDFTAIL